MEKRMKILSFAIVVTLLITSIAGAMVLLAAGKDNISTSTSLSSVRLQICGNANGDDIIDEKDIEAIQKIIDGGGEISNLTDANQDGVIDQKDIDQVEAIIDHEETRLYYVDIDGHNASVHTPVNSIIAIYNVYVEMVRALNATDLIVGVDDSISDYDTYFPELQSLPSVGNRFTPDVEQILSINPDVYFTGTRSYYDSELESKLAANGTDIDVVRLPCWEYGLLPQGMLTLGYILGHEDEAFEYLEWRDAILNRITEKVGKIAEENRTTSLGTFEGCAVSHGSGAFELMEIAGSNNIAGVLSSTGIYPTIEPEWVIENDPDVIVTWAVAGFYRGADISILQEQLDSTREVYRAATAVAEGRTYVMAWDITCGPSDIISVAYYAKWFYPDLFTDLDPAALHQEYIDRFCGGIDLDVSTGAFVL